MLTQSGVLMVLAEGVSPEQLKQLAAVMLGLVVFAAVFALVERQRARRGGEDSPAAPPTLDLPAPPTVEYPPWTPPPQRATAPGLPGEGELQDELPVPFVPRGSGPARPPASPAIAPVTADPEVAGPEAEPVAPEPVRPPRPEVPPDRKADDSAPESPDEIGIIIPDEPPDKGKPAEG